MLCVRLSICAFSDVQVERHSKAMGTVYDTN